MNAFFSIPKIYEIWQKYSNKIGRLLELANKVNYVSVLILIIKQVRFLNLHAWEAAITLFRDENKIFSFPIKPYHARIILH